MIKLFVNSGDGTISGERQLIGGRDLRKNHVEKKTLMLFAISNTLPGAFLSVIISGLWALIEAINLSTIFQDMGMKWQVANRSKVERRGKL